MKFVPKFLKRTIWGKSFKAERDEEFRQELGAVARRGLRVFGRFLVFGSASWLFLTVILFDKRIVWRFAEDSDPNSESVLLLVCLFALGALVLLTEKAHLDLSLSRLTGGVALLICAVLLHSHELLGQYDSSVGSADVGLLLPAAINIIYFMLIFLIGSGVFPLHPFHTLALGFALIVEYVTIELIIQNQHGFIPLSPHTGAVAWMTLITVFHSATSGLLYINRWRLFLARKHEHRLRQKAVQLNELLYKTQAQLVQTSKMASLGDWVAGVAHEMNTPLGSISSSADVVFRSSQLLIEHSDPSLEQSDKPPVDKFRRALFESLDTLQQGVVRINSVVADLRKFARLDQADNDVVRIEDCVEETLALLEYRLSDKIAVVRNYSNTPLVYCSPRQLNQVFVSVLSNALDAMPEGGTISASSHYDDAYVTVEIADDGIGIPVVNLERVFDPGFTTKGVGVGIGMGLAICYQVIKDHDGNIFIMSKPGKGSKVTVRLPRSKPSNAASTNI